ncbi:MAG: ATP-binding protein [Thermodesulfobacteriota bacterium]|nr:ATP-binding protein [Thermodesulfobacteriota bacterium]
MATLLFVDDEPMAVQLISRFLKKHAHTVYTAGSGPEAVEIFEQRSDEIDILITDISMPGMSGIELMKKAMSGRLTLQAIVVTAYGEIDVAIEAMKMGAMNYLRKPLDLEELSIAVDKCMEKIKLIRRIESGRELELRLAMQAQEAAESASIAKTQFLANMTHEFKTPLNHIIGFTELLADKDCGELTDVQEEYLEDIRQSSRRLLSLINDVLDISRIEADKMEMETADVCLKTLLDNSITSVKETASRQGVHLSLEMGQVPEVIKADEQKLRRILDNLLSNALKFTPDRGIITLMADSADNLSSPGGDPGPKRSDQRPETENQGQVLQRESIRISVIDTGIGLHAQDLTRVFEPFEQVDASLSREHQGAGLGLTLTKKLVELHGGKIWATSEGKGKGAEFSFIIPFE